MKLKILLILDKLRAGPLTNIGHHLIAPSLCPAGPELDRGVLLGVECLECKL